MIMNPAYINMRVRGNEYTVNGSPRLICQLVATNIIIVNAKQATRVPKPNASAMPPKNSVHAPRSPQNNGQKWEYN